MKKEILTATAAVVTLCSFSIAAQPDEIKVMTRGLEGDAKNIINFVMADTYTVEIEGVKLFEMEERSRKDNYGVLMDGMTQEGVQKNLKNLLMKTLSENENLKINAETVLTAHNDAISSDWEKFYVNFCNRKIYRKEHLKGVDYGQINGDPRKTFFNKNFASNSSDEKLDYFKGNEWDVEEFQENPSMARMAAKWYVRLICNKLTKDGPKELFEEL